MAKFEAHPTAIIDHGAQIGDGTKIWHWVHICGHDVTIGENCSFGQNCYVGNHVNIGSHVKIQNNVSIYDHVSLEDEVFCGPSVVFTNVINPRSAIPRKHEYRKTLIKKGASLGANCTIVCGNTIGEYAFVAAGAVVTRDVPKYAIVAGVPAKPRGWMCECGLKLTVLSHSTKSLCATCHKAYHLAEDRKLLTREN